jgi:hypothetical protein
VPAASPEAALAPPADSAWSAWPKVPVPLTAGDGRPPAPGDSEGLPAAALPVPGRAAEPPLVVAQEPVALPLTGSTREERRPREPWETLLLIMLFIGLVAAALWALVSNGVFSPAL